MGVETAIGVLSDEEFALFEFLAAICLRELARADRLADDEEADDVNGAPLLKKYPCSAANAT
jgi:hypothetical protein